MNEELISFERINDNNTREKFIIKSSYFVYNRGFHEYIMAMICSVAPSSSFFSHSTIVSLFLLCRPLLSLILFFAFWSIHSFNSRTRQERKKGEKIFEFFFLSVWFKIISSNFVEFIIIITRYFPYLYLPIANNIFSSFIYI